MGYICIYTNGARYYFQGDTVMQGKQYEVMHSYKIISLVPIPFCAPYAVDPSLSGDGLRYMREDTAERRLYFWDTPNNMEELIFDFSLSEGDSLNVYGGGGNILVIDSIRNIVLEDGSLRKIFYLDAGFDFIEGIGNYSGLFGALIPTEYPMGLNCVLDNGVRLLGTDYSCLNFLTVEDVENAGSFSISSTVVTNTLEIRFLLTNEIMISIYNLMGEKVQEQKANGNSLEMDVSELPTGMYVVKESRNGVAKFFKE